MTPPVRNVQRGKYEGCRSSCMAWRVAKGCIQHRIEAGVPFRRAALGGGRLPPQFSAAVVRGLPSAYRGEAPRLAASNARPGSRGSASIQINPTEEKSHGQKNTDARR